MTEEAKTYHFKFRKALLENSDEKHDFAKACKEWSHTNYKHKEETNCICTKNILYNYSIKHHSGRVLEPVGSTCIKNIAEYNPQLMISFQKAKKIEIEETNYEKMLEGSKCCIICYSGRVQEMVYTKNNKECDYPILFCSKCTRLIKLQKEMKETLHKSIRLLPLYKKKLNIKNIRIIINSLNEALEKEKQLAATERYGSEFIKFGMYKNTPFKEAVNQQRFKSWFKYFMKKNDFIKHPLNQDLIDYCKYRLI